MTQLHKNQSNCNHHQNNYKDIVEISSKPFTDESKTSKPILDSLHTQTFEQSVMLRQSPVWSRTIMITLIALACFGVSWAYFAEIDQVIPATGQIKPEGAVKEIQAPIVGVVKAVYIKDGQRVKSGDVLLVFDSTATKSELESLYKIRSSLMRENKLYRHLMQSKLTEEVEMEFLSGNLPKETTFLIKNRSLLVAENEMLRTELRNSSSDKFSLDSDDKELLQAAKSELDSRTSVGELQIEQSKKKLTQSQVQIGVNQETLSVEKNILSKLRTLSEQGGVSELQYLQQQKQVDELTAEIAKSIEEQKRLNLEIEQGQQQLKNIVSAAHKTISDKIAENKKRISEIDTQLTKIILENEKQLAENNNKISQAKLNLKYQEIRAPFAGIVFDVQAKNPGFVASTGQKLLQIVSTDNLVAEVFITNKDIGFIKKGMKAGIRIDSFPYSEFGDIKGELTTIGSDALPPDQTHQFYRFPAKIRLDKQSILIGSSNVSFQSGMSISANLKVSHRRTFMNLFTEFFTRKIDNLKQVR
jgi:HlyD family secretion protein